MQLRRLSRAIAPALIFWGLINPASAASCKSGSPCRVLYLTYTAGFRHDSIPASKEVLQAVASQSGQLEVVPSEDLSLINADALSGFDALFFFTSGELPLTDRQKSDVLTFVRSGGGRLCATWRHRSRSTTRFISSAICHAIARAS